MDIRTRILKSKVLNKVKANREEGVTVKELTVKLDKQQKPIRDCLDMLEKEGEVFWIKTMRKKDKRPNKVYFPKKARNKKIPGNFLRKINKNLPAPL